METQNNEVENTQEVTINDPQAVLSALERAKADAKKFREEKEDLEARFEESLQTISKYTTGLTNQKVSDKLRENGIKDPSRALKFIDMSKIQMDDAFEIIGFEDQVEQLKADLPEIFDPKFRVGGQADSAVQATVTTQYSASEMQAMKIMGKI